jgi:hypothetical protein
LLRCYASCGDGAFASYTAETISASQRGRPLRDWSRRDCFLGRLKQNSIAADEARWSGIESVNVRRKASVTSVDSFARENEGEQIPRDPGNYADHHGASW